MDEESMPDLLESANPLEAAKMYEILYVTEPEESNTESKESSEAASYQKKQQQKTSARKIYRIVVRPRAVSKRQEL